MAVQSSSPVYNQRMFDSAASQELTVVAQDLQNGPEVTIDQPTEDETTKKLDLSTRIVGIARQLLTKLVDVVKRRKPDTASLTLVYHVLHLPEGHSRDSLIDALRTAHQWMNENPGTGKRPKYEDSSHNAPWHETASEVFSAYCPADFDVFRAKADQSSVTQEPTPAVDAESSMHRQGEIHDTCELVQHRYLEENLLDTAEGFETPGPPHGFKWFSTHSKEAPTDVFQQERAAVQCHVEEVPEAILHRSGAHFPQNMGYSSRASQKQSAIWSVAGPGFAKFELQGRRSPELHLDTKNDRESFADRKALPQVQKWRVSQPMPVHVLGAGLRPTTSPGPSVKSMSGSFVMTESQRIACIEAEATKKERTACTSQTDPHWSLPTSHIDHQARLLKQLTPPFALRAKVRVPAPKKASFKHEPQQESTDSDMLGSIFIEKPAGRPLSKIELRQLQKPVWPPLPQSYHCYEALKVPSKPCLYQPYATDQMRRSDIAFDRFPGLQHKTCDTGYTEMGTVEPSLPRISTVSYTSFVGLTDVDIPRNNGSLRPQPSEQCDLCNRAEPKNAKGRRCSSPSYASTPGETCHTAYDRLSQHIAQRLLSAESTARFEQVWNDLKMKPGGSPVKSMAVQDSSPLHDVAIGVAHVSNSRSQEPWTVKDRVELFEQKSQIPLSDTYRSSRPSPKFSWPRFGGTTYTDPAQEYSERRRRLKRQAK